MKTCKFLNLGNIDNKPKKFLNLLKEKCKENLPFECKFLYKVPYNIRVSREGDKLNINKGTLLCVRSFHGDITKNSASNFNFCRFCTGLIYTDDGNLEVASLKSNNKDIYGLCWWKQKQIKFNILEVKDA